MKKLFYLYLKESREAFKNLNIIVFERGKYFMDYFSLFLESSVGRV